MNFTYDKILTWSLRYTGMLTTYIPAHKFLFLTSSVEGMQSTMYLDVQCSMIWNCSPVLFYLPWVMKFIPGMTVMMTY